MKASFIFLFISPIIQGFPENVHGFHGWIAIYLPQYMDRQVTRCCGKNWKISGKVLTLAFICGRISSERQQRHVSRQEEYFSFCYIAFGNNQSLPTLVILFSGYWKYFKKNPIPYGMRFFLCLQVISGPACFCAVLSPYASYAGSSWTRTAGALPVSQQSV